MKERCFMVRNVRPDEIDLVLGENVPRGSLIAVLNGEFEKNGRQLTSVLTRKSVIARDDPDFLPELKDLVHYLRTDYANGLLFGAAEMDKVCAMCGDPFTLKGKGRSAYGFETHSEKYCYFLKCMPKTDTGTFTITCYDRQELIAAGLATDDGGI